MLDNHMKDIFLKITQNEFDQAQIILVYAGARPAATFSVPSSKIKEVQNILDTIEIYNGLGRTREDAEIIIGQRTNVEKLVVELKK